MLKVFCKLLRWYYDNRAARVSQKYGIDLKRAELGEGGELKLTFRPPDTLLTLADETAAMMADIKAVNYFEFTMLPKSVARPLVVTLRWYDGKTPAKKAYELREALEWVLYNGSRPEQHAGEEAASYRGRVARWQGDIDRIMALLAEDQEAADKAKELRGG